MSKTQLLKDISEQEIKNNYNTHSVSPPRIKIQDYIAIVGEKSTSKKRGSPIQSLGQIRLNEDYNQLSQASLMKIIQEQRQKIENLTQDRKHLQVQLNLMTNEVCKVKLLEKNLLEKHELIIKMQKNFVQKT